MLSDRPINAASVSNDQLRCRSQAYIFACLEPVAPLELTVLQPSAEECFLSGHANSGLLNIWWDWNCWFKTVLWVLYLSLAKASAFFIVLNPTNTQSSSTLFFLDRTQCILTFPNKFECHFWCLNGQLIVNGCACLHRTLLYSAQHRRMTLQNLACEIVV